MQGNIEQAMMLTAVGNAALRGVDVASFWPGSGVFRWTDRCEFRLPPPSGKDTDDYPLLAANPLQWFAKLKGVKGLRLHAVAPDREPYEGVGATPRMLVGMVGGGPRWVIEVVGKDRCELWQGFDRLGDRNHPNQKIWLTTWIRQAEVSPDFMSPVSFDDAVAAFRDVLPPIESYARRQGYDNFAECFASALSVLDGKAPAYDLSDRDELMRIAGFTDAQLNLRLAIGHAWVFGGMGSWNDLPGDKLYDDLSEALFQAICGAVCGLANASFSPV